MAGADRRDALLDAAASLIGSAGVEAVAMDTVAELSGVSRPLVYKHFGNRRELLSALYKREADTLHNELSTAVRAAVTTEEKFRALIHGSLRAAAERGAPLASLRAAGGRTDAVRQKQRSRDRTTVAHFARHAATEYGVDERTAKTCVSILLRAIDGVLADWRLRPTPQHAVLLEDAYVSIAVGALQQLGHPLGSRPSVPR